MVAGSAIENQIAPSTLFSVLTNDEAGAIVIGAPVYPDAPDGVKLAKADAAATAQVVGLVAEASVATTDGGAIVTSGLLTATTGQWDAVTGQVGGLTVGASYYLDAATAGMLSLSPGLIPVKIGVAISTTEMLVGIEGIASTFEIVSPQAASPVTVNASDSGTVYTNEGAGAEITFNLPAAAPGLVYTFIVQDTDGLKVVAGGGDTIRLDGSPSAAAGNAESLTVGSVLRLVAINATEWIAVSIVGTWSVT